MANSDLVVQGLHIFKSLIKDDCRWDGDICSNKWSECLYFTGEQYAAVARTLYAYESGVHFKLDGDESGGCVWVY